MYIEFGGRKLPYLTELALEYTPSSSRVSALVTAGIGIILGVGFAKKPFGSFPCYFSGIVFAFFLLCCALQMFMVALYYEVYADYVQGLEKTRVD